MKWRCTWCGKPHAENDPPCDNCGHNAFERAIVREGEREGSDSTATQTVDTGTTYVWTCPNCGRDHVRNNPPCSRCGNPDLEKTEQRYDDVDRELDRPGWLEVAKPYAPFLAVIALVAALFITGIVPPSVLPGIGAPTPPEAPGNGSERAGIDLEATEQIVHERLEDSRQEPRSYDPGLAAYAEYRNRAYVAKEYDDASPDAVAPGDFDTPCGGPVRGGLVPTGVPIDEFEDEDDLADAVAAILEPSDGGTAPEYTAEGLDLHVAPDDTVVGYYATC
ncbi:hypothetical protein [Halopiger djelfimassiliensis]|uniref:hypothetical protein n=1 Tax=Halopiger djelfimassiliensis TaxID=1293047 RepID=UPI0006780B84|nr:hypothetical protein [Halopiger djelfimassiliensis]